MAAGYQLGPCHGHGTRYLWNKNKFKDTKIYMKYDYMVNNLCDDDNSFGYVNNEYK